MRDVSSVMEEACGTGELISVVYYGGSQPGSRRELQPLRVTPPYVYAFCHDAGEFRTFRLDKMQLADGSGTHAPGYVARPQKKAGRQDKWQFPALAQRIAEVTARPEWHVETSALRIAVFDRFKNGKPRKAPFISLERRSDGFVLRGKQMSTRTFRYLDRAATALLKALGLPDEQPTAPMPAPPRSRDALRMPERQIPERQAAQPATPARTMSPTLFSSALSPTKPPRVQHKHVAWTVLKVLLGTYAVFAGLRLIGRLL